jgi:PadR family transcriptional regulator, regulatory protein PadR
MPSKVKERVDLLQGTLDLIVLGVLATMGPKHAYGIASHVEQISEELL